MSFQNVRVNTFHEHERKTSGKKNQETSRSGKIRSFEKFLMMLPILKLERLPKNRAEIDHRVQ